MALCVLVYGVLLYSILISDITNGLLDYALTLIINFN